MSSKIERTMNLANNGKPAPAKDRSIVFAAIADAALRRD